MKCSKERMQYMEGISLRRPQKTESRLTQGGKDRYRYRTLYQKGPGVA
jgi:hypothetical protein